MCAQYQMGTVIKAYQEEINELTRRGKYGEAAFASVYGMLYEIYEVQQNTPCIYILTVL